MNRIFVLTALAILFLPFFAEAQMINEIYYSPASKQWIEIYNNTAADIDITQYKILDAGAAVNGHSITPAIAGGSGIIPAHEYGIIAKDITSVNATHLFHSALGISTSQNDTVTLKNGANVLDTVNVPINSALNGNSWQLIDAVWTATLPTPAAVNQISNPPPPAATGSLPAPDLISKNTSTEATMSTENKNKNVEISQPKIKAEISAKDFGFVGLPMSFKATTYGVHGEQLRSGKYFWNFGDGDSKEISATESAALSHAYFYPGEYTVSLDYFSNNYFYSEVPDAASEMTIKIIPAQIIISRVGDEADFFVEITNDTDYSADLSNYILQSETKNFVIPRNTILPSKKSLIISPKITNLSSSDKSSLKLIQPDGGVAYDFGATVVRQDLTTKALAKSLASEKISTSENKNQNISLAQMEAPENNLTATAIESEAQNSNNTHSKIIFIIFAIFLGISAVGVYFVRSRGSIRSYENDFEILDE